MRIWVNRLDTIETWRYLYHCLVYRYGYWVKIMTVCFQTKPLRFQWYSPSPCKGVQKG